MTGKWLDYPPQERREGGLDSQVGIVVGQSAKVPGSIPGGAKVLGTDGICKYLRFGFILC